MERKKDIARRIAMLVAAGALCGPALAQHGHGQETRQASAQPAVVVGSPLEFDRSAHDFGTILDTTTQQTVFRFTNTGSKAVDITEVRSSCGCTVPELIKKRYAPGESGELTVVFNPQNRRGPQHRVVTVSTDDGQPGRELLRINAEVQPAIEVTPRAIQFGTVKPGESQVVMVDIVSRIEGVTIEDPRVSFGEGFDVEMIAAAAPDEIDGRPVKRTTLMVSLSDKSPIGRISGRVSLSVTDPNGTHGLHTIPVTGQIIGDLRIAPTRVNLGLLAPGETYDRSVRIASQSRKPFKIIGIEENPITGPDGVELDPVLHDVQWEATSVAEGMDSAFNLSVRGTFPTDGTDRIYTRLVILTDRPDEKRIPVYVTGRLRPESVPAHESPAQRGSLPIRVPESAGPIPERDGQ